MDPTSLKDLMDLRDLKDPTSLKDLKDLRDLRLRKDQRLPILRTVRRLLRLLMDRIRRILLKDLRDLRLRTDLKVRQHCRTLRYSQS
jgi:hypothetical protein